MQFHLRAEFEYLGLPLAKQLSCPSFCTSTSVRVYIKAKAFELEFGGPVGLQAVGAGSLQHLGFKIHFAAHGCDIKTFLLLLD